MKTLNLLPSDIIYEITKYLTLKDICILKSCFKLKPDSIYNDNEQKNKNEPK